MRRTQPLLLLLSLVPACHTSSSGVNDTGAAEQACALDAQTYCDKRKTCWPEGINDFRFQQSWGTVEKCVSDRKASCMADVGRQGSGLAPTRVESCAMALQAQSCPNFLAGIALPTSACPPVVGQLDDSATCVAADQCKSNYCDRTEDQLCGKCTDKGGIGGACDQNSDCAGGLTCQATADTLAHACMMPGPAAAKAREGEACGGTLPGCDTGLTCVGTAMMKTCMPDVMAAGNPCDPTHKMLADCDSTTMHLWCNRTSLTCEPRKFAAVGQPCNELPDGTFALCSAGARCVRPKDATGARPPQGTCVSGAAENAPCYRDGSDGPGCAVTLRCVYDAVGAATGKCLAQVPAACGKVVAHDAGAGG
jgi:hypothetical protein